MNSKKFHPNLRVTAIDKSYVPPRMCVNSIESIKPSEVNTWTALLDNYFFINYTEPYTLFETHWDLVMTIEEQTLQKLRENMVGLLIQGKVK